LPKPTIEFVFSDSSKTGSVSPVLQMADAKALLNDIPEFGDFFVTFNFIFSQSSRD
jgi:hypothetical protein